MPNSISRRRFSPPAISRARSPSCPRGCARRPLSDAARRHRLGKDDDGRQRHRGSTASRRSSSRTTRRSPRSSTARSRSFFPHNAVEYFISYYDYYQPEAYVPHDRHVHREGRVDQRGHRPAAPARDVEPHGARRRHHRRDRVVHLRPRRSRWSIASRW